MNPFVRTYLSNYKGRLSSGGVTWERGLAGVRGVGTKGKRLGLVRKRSSVRTCLSIMKSPSLVKCRRPIKVAKRPSKKSYAITGTRAPSKYVSQSGGNCPKRNLSESIKDDSRYPKGK